MPEFKLCIHVFDRLPEKKLLPSTCSMYYCKYCCCCSCCFTHAHYRNGINQIVGSIDIFAFNNWQYFAHARKDKESGELSAIMSLILQCSKAHFLRRISRRFFWLFPNLHINCKTMYDLCFHKQTQARTHNRLNTKKIRRKNKHEIYTTQLKQPMNASVWRRERANAQVNLWYCIE